MKTPIAIQLGILLDLTMFMMGDYVTLYVTPARDKSYRTAPLLLRLLSLNLPQ